jgi:hypothetical protein
MPRPFNLSSILAPVGNIVAKLKARRDQLLAEADMIGAQIERFGGSVKAKVAKVGKRAKGKRVRRSREDLEKQAVKVVAFIKAAGAEGTTGKEIKAEFGPLLPSPKQWLKSYAPDQKVKVTGAKTKTRYSA